QETDHQSDLYNSQNRGLKFWRFLAETQKRSSFFFHCQYLDPKHPETRRAIS
ncbi:hypothetical protein LINPERHAP2_LOCUS19443, partial [Linum perenne]